MKFAKTLSSIVAAAVAVSAMAISAFAEPLATFTLEENGQPASYGTIMIDPDGTADLSTVASAVVTTSGTTDYAKGIIGGNDLSETWYKSSEVEYTIDADGNGTATFEDLPGFTSGAQIQFYWINKGTLNVESITLYDADGEVVFANPAVEEEVSNVVEVEEIAVFTLEENGQPAGCGATMVDPDGAYDLTTVTKVVVTTVGTTDYAKGIFGGNDLSGSWCKSSEVEYTIDADGNGTATFDGFEGFTSDAQVQFYWINAGVLGITSITLYDANDEVVLKVVATNEVELPEEEPEIGDSTPVEDEDAPADDEDAPTDDENNEENTDTEVGESEDAVDLIPVEITSEGKTVIDDGKVRVNIINPWVDDEDATIAEGEAFYGAKEIRVTFTVTDFTEEFDAWIAFSDITGTYQFWAPEDAANAGATCVPVRVTGNGTYEVVLTLDGAVEAAEFIAICTSLEAEEGDVLPTIAIDSIGIVEGEFETISPAPGESSGETNVPTGITLAVVPAALAAAALATSGIVLKKRSK